MSLHLIKASNYMKQKTQLQGKTEEPQIILRYLITSFWVIAKVG